jgi:hypothetical protein
MNKQLRASNRRVFQSLRGRLTSKALLFLSVLMFFHSICANAQIATIVPSAGTSLDQTLTIVLTPRGFHPHYIDIQEGTTSLIVLNRSRISKLTVHVWHDGDSTAAITSQHDDTHRDNVFYFTIKAGAYHLDVDEQSAWQFRLTVVPKLGN